MEHPDERAEALEHLDFAVNEFREIKDAAFVGAGDAYRGLLKA